jgi:hypothetical protein
MTFPLRFDVNGYGQPAVWNNTDPDRPLELDRAEMVALIRELADTVQRREQQGGVVTPRRYRWRSAEVEAVQIDCGDPDGLSAIAEWSKGRVVVAPIDIGPVGIAIDTLEGTMCGDHGGWIIRTESGESYPVAAHLFESAIAIEDGAR